MPTIVRPVYAQICNPALPWLPCDQGQQGGGIVVGNLISSLLAFFLIIAGLLSFFYLVQGGLQWITTGGDKTAIEAARNRIIHAIIGLILVASSWALITLLLNNFLGMDFPNIKIPSIGQQMSNGVNPGDGNPNQPPADTTWYGCAPANVIRVGEDTCTGGQQTVKYQCQPSGCTWNSQGECQTQNQGTGQCPASCEWQSTEPC